MTQENLDLKLLTHKDHQSLYLEAIQGAQDDDALFTRLCFSANKKFPIGKNLFANKGQPLNRSENGKIKTLEEDADKYNTYVTINAFKYVDGEIKKSKDYLKSIGTIYLDIDFHTVLNQETEELINDVLRKIDGFIESGILLAPSMIVRSGRGLGIYYCLWKAIPKEDMQNVRLFFEIYFALFQLYEKMLDVKLDASVIDTSRIARIAGTINLNSGTYCELVFYNQDDNNQLVRYSLEELNENIKNEIDEKVKNQVAKKISSLYGIKLENKIQKIEKSEKNKKAKRINIPKRQIELDDKYLNNYKFLSKFIENVVDDMGDQFDHEGTGRQKLVCAYFSYQLLINQYEAYDKAYNLNSKFALPLSFLEFNAVIKGVKDNQPYLFSKDGILKDTIITHADADRLGLFKYEKRRTEFEKKRIARKKRNELIIELYQKNLSVRQIQRRLNEDYGMKCSIGNISKIIGGYKFIKDDEIKIFDKNYDFFEGL